MQFELDLHGKPEPPPVAAPEPKVFSVAELTRRVRDLIERGIGEVWVEGEISNLRRQSSGHSYFTLKDGSSQLACVLFSGAAAGLKGLKLADGQSVQLFGAVTVYEARGQYQMIVRLVQNRGEGALQAKFEALKRALAAEGLFDTDRKRPLPRFPQRVGLVTSPTGAAIQDFLNVLHRRHPGIEVVINPARVQGKGAAAEIARAIREFGEWEKHDLPVVDVIVVTRGGGSIEDLWEFNEEAVARAIAASPIPVVSAVGHEIDFTIADFAADLRAPTPSAAAEILAADRVAVMARLRQDASRLTNASRGRLTLLDTRLRAFRQSPLFQEPARRLREMRQTLDRQADTLSERTTLAVERRRHVLGNHIARLAAVSPTQAIQEVRHTGALFLRRMEEALRTQATSRRTRLARASGVLEALNPHATLARGYTITLDAEGKPLTSAENVHEGASLRTRFHDGEVETHAAKHLTPAPGRIKKKAT
jgi:exodeoxyribonuclease VII large subunit